MTTNADIKHDWQQADVGELVTMYVLDATDIGGAVYRFTPTVSVSGTVRSAVVFQGQTYFPLDIEASGFEWKGEGQLPRPKIKVNSREETLRDAINTYDDLIGCVIYRKRTFSKYLDGQPLADANAEFPIDIYTVERKTSQNQNFVEFELAAYMDHQGKKIPGRICIRDTCTHRYRYWNGSSFDYTNATCPYDGSNYFTREGLPTTAANDVCGRRLSDCKLRFGTYGNLPTRAFPGVGRNIR